MKPFSYNPHKHQKENKKNPFPLKETSGLHTAHANFYLEKKVNQRMTGNGCSFLSTRGPVGRTGQQGRTIQANMRQQVSS